MQCPNPQCNSTAISIKNDFIIADPGANIISRAFLQGTVAKGQLLRYVAGFFVRIFTITFTPWLVLPIMWAFIWFQLTRFFVYYSILIGFTGLIVIFLPGLLPILILLWLSEAGLYFYAYTKVEKFQIQEYKCKQCTYKWSVVSSDLNDIPKKIHWYNWYMNYVRKTRRPQILSYALTNLASAALSYQNNPQQAESYARQALSLLKDKKDQAAPLSILGLVLIYQSQFEQAERTLKEALDIYQTLKEWQGIAQVLHSLGFLYLWQGNYQEAKNLLVQSLVLYEKMNIKTGIVGVLEDLAKVAAAQHQALLACQLFGAEEALRKANNMPLPEIALPQYDHYVKLVASELDTTSFNLNWQQGQKMPMKQVILLALS